MSVFHENMLIGSSGQGGAAAYQIQRSLRFNSADSAYLSKAFGTPTDAKKQTYSFWVKRTGLGQISGFQRAITNAYTGGSTATGIYFDSDSIQVTVTNAGDNVKSTAVFRDASAWYHFVVAVDTTQATASNRVRIYVNGAEITSFSTASYPALNASTQFANSSTSRIGTLYNAGGYWFDGYLADFYYIDGQALTPSSFGEFDTNGVWQPKAFSGTYGTNGFRLDFSDNSAATATTLGADRSGNGNNWTPINLTAGPAFTSNSWSGYFDGTGDYLTVPDNAAWDFGTGNFTIETWVYPTTSGTQRVIGSAFSSAGSLGWSYELTSANLLTFYAQGAFRVTSTGSIPANTWTHVAVSRSGTSLKLFINGVTDGSVTDSTNITGSTGTATIAGTPSGTALFTGYQSNFRIVTGTAVYTANFTPATTPLTAITNTSLLALQSSTFVDNSANNFTITKFGDARVDYRSPFEDPVDTDSLVDSPTNYGIDTGIGGEVRGSYCTLNPLNPATATLSNGNLECATPASGSLTAHGTFNIPTSGKWYWEYTPTTNGAYSYSGIVDRTDPSNKYVVYWAATGEKYLDGVATGYGATHTSNDVIGVAVNSDAGTITFYKNNVSQGSISYSTLSNGRYTPLLADGTSDFGVNFVVNFGQRPFVYTAPANHKCLCTQNLPTPTILQGSTAMDVTTYTGDNTNNRTITTSNSSLKSGLVWIKSRSAAYNHILFDSLRGTSNYLITSTAGAENSAGNLSWTNSGATGSNSFKVDYGTNPSLNELNSTYVGWVFDAGSSTVTNTSGTISSQVRANASAGFSAITYTGTGAAGSIGHGLGVAPSFYIIKRRDGSTGWNIYTTVIDGSLDLFAFDTAAKTDSTLGLPTSSLINLGSGLGINASTGTYVCYSWAPVAGYSAFGTYTGNGSSDGPMVFCGFRPAFLIVKSSSAAGGNWMMYDKARGAFNLNSKKLGANAALEENNTANFGDDTLGIDFLSNGFKIRQTGVNHNDNAATYIYCAFAEHPFSLARAR